MIMRQAFHGVSRYTRAFTLLMSTSSIFPKGEDLRRAIMWMAAQRGWNPTLMEDASQRFDLSPADEEFLIREYRRLGECDET